MLAASSQPFTTAIIELQILSIQGKWKVSQNQPPQNQASVVQGLWAEGSEASAHMARLIPAG